MQGPDQVGVRWHIGVQPAVPSLYWISVFAFFTSGLYITLLFFVSPDLAGFFWNGEGDMSFVANERTGSGFRKGNSLATVEWWEPRY